jgi:hypothetical protein
MSLQLVINRVPSVAHLSEEINTFWNTIWNALEPGSRETDVGHDFVTQEIDSCGIYDRCAEVWVSSCFDGRLYLNMRYNAPKSAVHNDAAQCMQINSRTTFWIRVPEDSTAPFQLTLKQRKLCVYELADFAEMTASILRRIKEYHDFDPEEAQARRLMYTRPPYGPVGLSDAVEKSEN